MPWGRTFLLGLGFFGISLIWPLYDSYVPIFLRTFGLTNAAVGFLMTLDNYANLFIQPWIGDRSDGTRTRIGRRYPYILVGAPIAALGVALIPVAASTEVLPLLVGSMLLMTLSMALFRTPTVSLLGDVFPPKLRSKANGVINFMGLLAGIIAFLVGGMLYRINPPLPFWIAAVTMLAVLALLMVLVREPAVPASTSESEHDEEVSSRPRLIELLSSVWHNPDRSVLLILSALFCWSVGITALQAFFTLFGTNELGLDEGTSSQLLSFYPIAGLLFAIPGGYLGTHLGRKRTIMGCLVVLAAALGAFLLIPSSSLGQVSTFTLLAPGTWFSSPVMSTVILLLMTAGAMLTIITVNILPMLYDAAPGGHIGSYTGLYYVFGSLASIVGPPVGGQLVDLTGTYRAIFFFAPIFILIAIVLLAKSRGGEPAVTEPPSMQTSLADS